MKSEQEIKSALTIEKAYIIRLREKYAQDPFFQKTADEMQIHAKALEWVLYGSKEFDDILDAAADILEFPDKGNE